MVPTEDLVLKILSGIREIVEVMGEVYFMEVIEKLVMIYPL